MATGKLTSGTSASGPPMPSTTKMNSTAKGRSVITNREEADITDRICSCPWICAAIVPIPPGRASSRIACARAKKNSDTSRSIPCASASISTPRKDRSARSSSSAKATPTVSTISVSKLASGITLS